MKIGKNIMEKYTKFRPKLRKKFDKVQLREIPGWRNQDSQVAIEMKIEPKVPALVKDRSDFNKNLIYPQWKLPCGITYSPKANKGRKESNHSRTKSDQDIFKQLKNKSSGNRGMQPVYLKKVRFVEDEEEGKRIEGLDGNKSNEELDKIESEKVQVPFKFYEFLVKENKDFDFVRNRSEEEFFSKEGFRVSHENAYTERVFVRDQIHEDIREDSQDISIKGKWGVRINEEKNFKTEKDDERVKSEKKEEKVAIFGKGQNSGGKFRHVEMNDVEIQKDVIKEVKMSLGVKEDSITEDRKTEYITKPDHTKEDNKKEVYKKDTHKEGTKKEDAKTENNKKEVETNNKNKKQQINKTVNNKEDSINTLQKVEDSRKKIDIKNEKMKPIKKPIDQKNPQKNSPEPDKNLKNIEIKFHGNPKNAFPIKFPEQKLQFSENEDKSSPISKLTVPIPQTNPETPKPVLQELELISNPNKELLNDRGSSSSSNKMSISPSLYKNLRKAKTIDYLNNPSHKTKFFKKSASTEDLQDKIVPDAKTELTQKENYTGSDQYSDKSEQKSTQKAFKRTERRTKSLTSSIKIKDSSGKLNKNLIKTDKNSPKLLDDQNNAETPKISTAFSESALAVLQKANTVVINARNFSETVHEESAEEDQNRTNNEETVQGAKTESVKVVEQKFGDVKNKLPLGSEKNQESIGTVYAKKQDVNIFARKNRKSLIVVSNVPQVKEETLESSKLLQVSKANKNSPSPFLSKIAKRTSKVLSGNELKGLDLPSIKKALRTFAEKMPDELKEEKRMQKQKKNDEPNSALPKQLVNARQRNSIRVEIKDFAGIKKPSNLPNLSEKSRRKGKKRETYNSSVGSSDYLYDSADSEDAKIINKDRNLNTLQYELNLLEKSKKIDSPMPEEEKTILKSSSKIENSESSSSFDAGIDVDKELADLAKTKNFHLNSLILNRPISFKFAHKVEMNSGVNVNELEINECNKDFKNLDCFLKKQRFLNYKNSTQFDFDQGIFYLHVKDVEDVLPGEVVQRTGKGLEDKEKVKISALNLNKKKAFKGGSSTEKFSIFRKRPSLNERTRKDAFVRFEDKEVKGLGGSYGIRNSKSLQSLDFQQSESARDLLNSIRASMEVLEKVYNS